MAFKRSAVRSRLSPPEGNRGKALGHNGPGLFPLCWDGWRGVARRWGIDLPNLAFPWEFWGYGYGVGSLAFGCAGAGVDAVASKNGSKKRNDFTNQSLENVNTKALDVGKVQTSNAFLSIKKS